MIADFSHWLATTSPSLYIGDHSWITPVLQSIHILAIAALTGATLMLSARLLHITNVKVSIARVEARFRPCFWWALLVLLLTGIGLTIGEPDRELLNKLFRVKMLMVLVIASLFWVLGRRLRVTVDAWDGAEGRWLAIGFSLLWLAIVTAGRWIAYI